MSIVDKLENNTRENYILYNDLVNEGVGKELARFYLPCSTYTHMYMRMNVHNLLRLAEDAQKEIQVYAEAMYQLFAVRFPIIAKAFDELVRSPVSINGTDQDLLKRIMRIMSKELTFETTSETFTSKRQQNKFLEKFKFLA